jgi:hypothetical protein
MDAIAVSSKESKSAGSYCAAGGDSRYEVSTGRLLFLSAGALESGND